MEPTCRVTHDLILAGTCPWCGFTIIDGRIDPIPPHHAHSETSTSRKWNISAFTAAFATKPKHYLLTALSSILLRDSSTEPFLPILRLGINHFDPDIRLLTVQILVRRGAHMLSHEAEQYGKILQDDPDDAVVRSLLLCYHSNQRDSFFETARLTRQEHILWMIENYPCITRLFGPYGWLDPSTDGDEICLQAMKLWCDQIGKNENNAIFLENIAEFFIHHEPELSKTFYLKAKAIEPNNPRWPQELAHLYVLQKYRSKDDVEHKDLSRNALTEYEAALDLETNQLGRFLLHRQLAEQAFEADELEKARFYATELLRMASLPHKLMLNDGDAIHNGHLILGRIALKSGDKEKAKWHLLEAGKSKGSSDLRVSGPKMMLAKELLDIGERDVVIQYLKFCTNFWQSSKHQAEQWIYKIEHGDIPDFGRNIDKEKGTEEKKRGRDSIMGCCAD